MTGVLVAIGAQLTLYLMLRRIAVATMPAWAHGHAHHPAPVSAWPSVVGVALVSGPATPVDPTMMLPLAPVTPPTLQPVPVVAVEPPVLGGSDPGR